MMFRRKWSILLLFLLPLLTTSAFKALSQSTNPLSKTVSVMYQHLVTSNAVVTGTVQQR